MVVVDREPVRLGFVLSSMRHFMDKLEIDFARVAAQFAADTEWDDEGYNTPADWMRFNCHMGSGAAWNAITVGEQLDRLSESTQAVASGDIGFAHLATIANTADKVKSFDESELLPLARKHSPGKFYYDALHHRHSVDAKAYCEEQSNQQSNHRLSLSTGQSGHLLISGVIEPVGGAALRSVLEELAKPMGAHDDRPREVRLADAAVELATGGKPVNLQVTATIETLKALAGAAGGEMEFSLPVSATAVQRIACDCAVTRVLLDQESVVMDLGRSKRVVNPSLRKALAVRDKHCQWPGCERPASWCDGHHILHWIHGGETNLDNCVLLCKRHHRMVHEGGWHMVKTEGEIAVIAPTITFSLARGPD